MGRRPQIPLLERNRKHINVTYCKRRKTLFSKAAELALECEVPIALIVSSTGRLSSKFYAFGNPSVDQVLDAFTSGDCNLGEFKTDPQIKQLWEEVKKLEIQVKNKNKIQKEKEKEKNGETEQQWWMQDISNMGLDELCKFGSKLERLQKDVKNQLIARENDEFDLLLEEIDV